MTIIHGMALRFRLRNIEVQRCYGPALQFENWPNGQIR